MPAKQIHLGLKEEALYKHVLELLKTKKSLRAYGSGHSKLYHSAIFDATTMIDMRNFVEQPVLEQRESLNGSENILTVSAGMVLDDIRNFLKPYNLKLYGTPDSKLITIGGAILFSVHNGSGYWDSMANYVIDMLLIDGTGKIRLITDPKLFINYGLLGIVFRIRLRVFPATRIKWEHTLVKNIDKIKISNSTYCLVFGPYSGRILKTDIYLTDQQNYRSFKRIMWDICLWPLNFKLVSKVIKVMLSWLQIIAIFASEIFTYEPSTIRAKFDYFESVPSLPVFTVEYSIDKAYLDKVYPLLMKLIADYRKKGTYILRFWCRFQNASKQINDLAFRRSTALVEITLNDKQEHALSLVHDISKILLQFGGKPHLGKTIIQPNELSNYDFTLLKQAINKYDPQHKFQNKFSKIVFGNT